MGVFIVLVCCVQGFNIESDSTELGRGKVLSSALASAYLARI